MRIGSKRKQYLPADNNERRSFWCSSRSQQPNAHSIESPRRRPIGRGVADLHTQQLGDLFRFLYRNRHRGRYFAQMQRYWIKRRGDPAQLPGHRRVAPRNVLRQAAKPERSSRRPKVRSSFRCAAATPAASSASRCGSQHLQSGGLGDPLSRSALNPCPPELADLRHAPVFTAVFRDRRVSESGIAVAIRLRLSTRSAGRR